MIASEALNDIDNLKETIYRGNGKPSLLSRMEVVEKQVAALTRVAWIFLTATIMLLVTQVGEMILQHK